VIWALAGIAVKQNRYPNIVITAEMAIAVILISMALSLLTWRLKHKTT
jgi:hypothetical protein